jgi:hypothetical protein
MKIEYQLQTPWPTDVANPDDYDAIDWTRRGEIPFLPVVGMHIDCGDGDLRVVRAVYWWASKPDYVEVYFEDDTPRALDFWMSGGWKTDDLVVIPPRKKAHSAKAGGTVGK